METLHYVDDANAEFVVVVFVGRFEDRAPTRPVVARKAIAAHGENVSYNRPSLEEPLAIGPMDLFSFWNGL